jgi:hypothetical protein
MMIQFWVDMRRVSMEGDVVATSLAQNRAGPKRSGDGMVQWRGRDVQIVDWRDRSPAEPSSRGDRPGGVPPAHGAVAIGAGARHRGGAAAHQRIALGKRAITADTDLRLARYFGVSEGFFLNLQKDHDLMDRRRKIAAVLASIRPRKSAD